MSSDLTSIFTQKETATLVSGSVNSLYDFVTYFPYGLEIIEPLNSSSNFPTENKTFLLNAVLKSIEHRAGKKNFLVLNFYQDGQIIKVYSFNSAKYLHSLLKIDETFQLLLKFSGGFWNLLKIAKKQTLEQEQPFILGKMAPKKYLQPKYLKNKALTSTKINQLHRKLKPFHYQLNLEGLAPKNSLFPQSLDLIKIHKPVSLEEFYDSLKTFKMLNLFLFLATTKYANSKNQTTQAIAGKLDLNFLKSMSSNLPFVLSQSQKLAIWEILKDITDYEN
jgi:RecG-like helicase